MSVSAARALAGELRVYSRDAGAEAVALGNIAAWAGQFTPAVSQQPPWGLLLEVAGSLRLFGGLDAIFLRVRQGLGEMGYTALCACAPTPLGAWLFARAGMELQVRGAGELERRLRPLPVALLSLPPATAEALDAVGIRTLGECLAQPRDGLARRFGQGLLDDLDRALGRMPDPRKFFIPPPRFESGLELPAEVGEAEAVLFAARRLLLELEGFLKGRGGGVQRCVLDLLHDGLPPTRVEIGLASPDRDSRRLQELLRERLVRTELPAPVRALALAADRIVPLGGRNLSLFPDASQEEENWDRFVERLRARLGAEAVHGICPVPDHRPEHAWRACSPGHEVAAPASGPRPLWLLPKPRPLPKVSGRPCLGGPLALKHGPERIESGWWDGQPVARDYYVAETPAGARFWIFWEGGGWYVHGIAG